MSEHALIQQQRAILRALRQANTRHAQVITAADAQWQQVQQACDGVRARLAQVGEERLLQSAAAATPAAPPAADPAEPFQRSVARVLAGASHIQELLNGTPSWQPSAIWKAHDKKALMGLRGHIYVTFSPDSRLLASGSEDGTVRLWRVPGAEG